MSKPVWTKEAIKNFLEKEVLHYQKIELPFGMSTPGTERRETCEKIFGENVKGKTVLDVGCSLGFFCLEALARGARRAVGWELNPDRVRQAQAIAEMLGSSAEYYTRNIEEVTPKEIKEIFDVVICLNVLHHVVDPIATLDKLVKLTGETLILELASLGGRDRRKLRLSPWQSWFLARAPAMVVGGPHTDQKFLFTRSAMIHLLKFQRHHFGEVRIVDSEFKDRFIVIAHRRRINHLVIVAGPTSSGKSTLIEAMMGNQLPELVASLGINNLKEWQVGQANAVTELIETDVQGLILNYDFLGLYRRRTRSYHDDKAFHLLEVARKVSFVTLWTPPPRLERQFLEAEVRTSRLRSRHSQILQIYRQPSEVFKFYDYWFEFCGTRANEINRHIVVEFNRSLKFYSPAEWKNVVRNYGTGSE